MVYEYIAWSGLTGNEKIFETKNVWYRGGQTVLLSIQPCDLETSCKGDINIF